ncbi:DNA phosphorothioation-associated protein 4 [Actinokineospora cianjurensis]|uniref:Dnd system-associated protein 4 n=1 Tax=Actinokineospora cianjurensis TaxID=585224 RepID=A0A421B580_9PSEU|nr:DNA phosphorothioation-associated protein 4 [Actinokineospora cianjurensis]RLK59606.1 dnd system-associated protein 4 [Actinokineospora cianjurensis]
MTAPMDHRARRPAEHERLIHELRDDAGFGAYRDILIFAAALGFRNDRRKPVTKPAGDPIRYEVLISGSGYSEALINMIAVNVSDDPEIMDDARLEERIKIFEEYANGGLDCIQEQINVRHQTAALVVTDLVTEALSDSGGATAASVEELLSSTTW